MFFYSTPRRLLRRQDANIDCLILLACESGVLCLQCIYVDGGFISFSARIIAGDDWALPEAAKA